MQLSEAIELIQNSYLQNQISPTIWADLGCGSGLFTKALGYFLQPESIIYAVDKNNFLKPKTTTNDVEILPLQADFMTDKLNMSNMDGILMANSLHYVKDKLSFLERCKKYLKEDAHFLIVEYDTDDPVSKWVPFPENFSSLTVLFKKVGFPISQKLGERPSAFGRKMMYASLFSKK